MLIVAVGVTVVLLIGYAAGRALGYRDGHDDASRGLTEALAALYEARGKLRAVSAGSDLLADVLMAKDEDWQIAAWEAQFTPLFDQDESDTWPPVD